MSSEAQERMDYRTAFGAHCRALREQQGLSLRAFCAAQGLDPGNTSRLERGIMPPPKAASKLERYASHFNIRVGSSEWHRFVDLAAISSGRIPSYILEGYRVVFDLERLFDLLRGIDLTPRKLPKVRFNLKE